MIERNKMQAELKESLQRFQSVLDAVPESIIAVDETQTITDFSKGASAIFGYSAKEVLGKPLSMLIPENARGALTQQVAAFAASEDVSRQLSFSNDIHGIRKSGKPFPAEVSISKVFVGGQWIYTAVLRDITERRTLETQVRQTQKMEAMGTLAGGIAHDFNNILSAISGYAELATLNAKGNNAAQQNLEEVLVAGQRAKELVQQILAFSRQTEHERQPIELKSVVKEVCKFLRASLPTTVEIRQNFTKAPTIILGDPIQMHQVVMNLCANAEHTMRESGGFLELKVEHVTGETDDIDIHPDLTGGSYVRLTVRDTGAGMTPEVVERIFDPFFTTKGVGEGTGMGLAVVHGIVTSYGGCIDVESEPGQGTTFTIDFPKMKAKSIQAETKPLQQEFLMGHGHILFVEDEEALARLGKEAMRKLGYEVMVRTSSLEALEAFRADPLRFDAVVTDQTMPHMTGEALSRELLQIRPDVPIILCTGFSHHMTPEKAQAIGIRAFLMKPLLIKKLGQTLQEVLNIKNV